MTKNSIEQTSDQWLWFVDSELVEALARHDTLDAKSEKRPVQSPALVKALALNMEGKTEQALREVRTALEKGESLTELNWTAAHLEFQLGQYQESAQSYEKVLGAHPNHKAAIYNAALCFEKLERFEEAAKLFQKAFELDPKLHEANLGLGVCRLHLNQPEQALAAFDKCLEGKPGFDKALYGKAVALHSVGRADEALELYAKLLPANAANAELLTNMIGLALKLGKDAKVHEYS